MNQENSDFQFYNKHYIQTDDHGRITAIWSDGPHPDRDTTGAICINEKGSYQVYLIVDGERTEENPRWLAGDGIPLYRWDGEQVVPRTEEELAVDRLPSIKAAKLAELSAACNAAITAGCDVTLPSGATGHISMTAEDQINLTNACASVEAGVAAYPYHLDGELCAMYPAADIMAMGQTATAHKLHHTTYYNHMAAWVRRATLAELEGITYGAELPEDLAGNMAVILAAAGGGTDAV